MKENRRNTNAISLKHITNLAGMKRLVHYKFLLNTTPNYDLKPIEETVTNNRFEEDNKSQTFLSKIWMMIFYHHFEIP